MWSFRLTCLALPALLAGCFPRALTPLPTDPRPFGPKWTSTLQRSHPLAGRILDVKGRRWVDQATLEAALASANVAILGEVHDNADHHLLQALELQAMVGAGRTPDVLLEMVSVGNQDQLDAAHASADGVAEAVGWADSGWPPFALYRPIFEVALAARLPLVAANLSRATAREMMQKGSEALPEEVRTWLDRAPELTRAQLEQLRRQMSADHCSELPDSMMQPFVLAQRARDAQLAVRTAAAASKGGAVLVAGDAHARRDHAVPAWLAREAPSFAVVAVAHLEVEARRVNPDDYGQEYGGALPFDFIVFTPAAEREDPCAPLRHHRSPPSP